MNINDAFPSDYLKAADLKGRDVNLTVSGVAIEKLGDDTRPVVSFTGTKKKMTLNKTNANRIAAMHGLDTDDWLGKGITVFPTECELRGDMDGCIRVRSQAPSVKGQSAIAGPEPRNGPVDVDTLSF